MYLSYSVPPIQNQYRVSLRGGEHREVLASPANIPPLHFKMKVLQNASQAI